MLIKLTKWNNEQLAMSHDRIEGVTEGISSSCYSLVLKGENDSIQIKESPHAVADMVNSAYELERKNYSIKTES